MKSKAALQLAGIVVIVFSYLPYSPTVCLVLTSSLVPFLLGTQEIIVEKKTDVGMDFFQVLPTFLHGR